MLPVFLAMMLVGGSALAAFQEPPPTTEAAREQEPKSEPTGAQEPERSKEEVPNPFRPSRAVLELLGQTRDGVAPLKQPARLPEMKMRGLVKLKKRPAAAALVEVSGVGTYIVREDERLAFSVAASGAPGSTSRVRPQANGAKPSAPEPERPVGIGDRIPIVLRVEHVGSDGVVVQVGTLEEYLIIR